MAKLIIKLIHSVAERSTTIPWSRGRLRVVFLPDFNVKLGHRVYPAADLSEQISLAGKEASGTGNMKFAMNGALTIGTLDGANIEIREEVGADNFFLFGLTAPEVEQRRREGYNPRALYESNSDLREILDALSRRRILPRRPRSLRAARRPLCSTRTSTCCWPITRPTSTARTGSAKPTRDQERWTRMSILNVARIGKFSSDRAIRDYCSEIWKTWPVKIRV